MLGIFTKRSETGERVMACIYEVYYYFQVERQRGYYMKRDDIGGYEWMGLSS